MPLTVLHRLAENDEINQENIILYLDDINISYYENYVYEQGGILPNLTH